MKFKESEIKHKIDVIYDSKLKFNDPGRKIRRKTHNLTRDSDRNDPIDRWIKCFSFRDFEGDHRRSRGKFSILFRQNLTFNHFVNAEMSLQANVSKRFKDGSV